MAGDRENNIGVATGRSGLLVIDLDEGRGQEPPLRFAGSLNGRQALAMLVAELGEEIPTNTYEVHTPSDGSHLYVACRGEWTTGFSKTAVEVRHAVTAQVKFRL